MSAAAAMAGRWRVVVGLMGLRSVGSSGGRMGVAEGGLKGGAQGTRKGARSLPWRWARFVRQAMSDAIAAGGSSLKDFVDSTGKVVTDRFSIGPSVMRPFPVLF